MQISIFLGKYWQCLPQVIPVWLSASTFQWAACGRHYFLLQLKPIKIKYQMQVKLSSRCSFREVHFLSQEKEDYMTSAI